MMDIQQATQSFEKWLRKQIPVVESDLTYKHQQMAADRFLFLRATFYRWVQLWPQICPDLAKGPVVPAVADLHIENFGTWRDEEGRLVWGVNDFDEAAPLAYANDLVRVATSAHLASGSLNLSLADISLALLDGYQRSLEEGGEPLVLGRHHQTLRTLALQSLADPVEFWTKLEAKTAKTRDLPSAAKKSILALLPKGAETPEWGVITKPKGLGSLGRPRFVAFSSFHGEIIARETKTFVPSSVNWATGRKMSGKKVIIRTMQQAARCPDPFWMLKNGWQARRLSPDCRRIDLEDLNRSGDVLYVLRAMGKETANIHLGSPQSRSAILRDLKRQPQDWLPVAAQKMTEAIVRDWKVWSEG